MNTINVTYATIIIYEVVKLKYFINSREKIALERENYIEFLTSDVTQEFWDVTSVYMSYIALKKSNFAHFIEYCIHKDILLDSGFISKTDWIKLLPASEKFDKNTYEALCELRAWLEDNFGDANQAVSLIWGSDRKFSRRQAECNTYPINEAFYTEVNKIDETLSFDIQYSIYEKLLDKYNMPSCYYPFPLFKPVDYN